MALSLEKSYPDLIEWTPEETNGQTILSSTELRESGMLFTNSASIPIETVNSNIFRTA